MSRKTWVVSAVALCVLLAWAGYLLRDAARSPTIDRAPARSAALAPASAPAPAVLASADFEHGLRIEVTSVARVSADVIEVRVALINGAPASPLSIEDRFAETPAEAGSLSAAFLEIGGATRYFLLRDAHGTPICSRDVSSIPPGARREAWMRFGIPGQGATTAVLRFKGAPSLGPLPVPGNN